MKEEILLLKIHRALKEGKDHYEAIRKHWIINKKRVDKIQYVLGINLGRVECVFKPTKWMTVESGEDKGRLHFEGEESSQVVLLAFQKVEEQLLKRFGSGNPVAYAALAEVGL